MSQANFSDYRTYTSGSTMSIHRRVRISGTTLALAGAADTDSLGELRDDVVTSGDDVSVRHCNSTGTHKMVAHAAFSAFAQLYAAAAGRVDDSGSVPIGIALEAATAQDDIIEVVPLLGSNYQHALKEYAVDLTSFRTWDDMAVNLPAAAANDDFGYVTGTPGTNAPALQGVDAGGTAETQIGAVNVVLPPEYVDGETITLRVAALMLVVADATSTLDVNAYRADAPTVDICATAVQSINSATVADIDFTLTPTDCVAGDVINLVLTTVATDSGNAAPLINSRINKVSMLLDVNY